MISQFGYLCKAIVISHVYSFFFDIRKVSDWYVSVLWTWRQFVYFAT
jgi:hypothetical protein